MEASSIAYINFTGKRTVVTFKISSSIWCEMRIWILFDQCWEDISNIYRLKQSTFYRFDHLKTGTLVGEDKYGNKYFQNDYYFFGRNRWVEYNDKCNMDYDATMIPAEWHDWMHYSTDHPPTTHPRVNYKWQIDHTESFTGTNKQYVPFSTTRPKIDSWAPAGQKIKIGPPK